jgi:hypothetical protein
MSLNSRNRTGKFLRTSALCGMITLTIALPLVGCTSPSRTEVRPGSTEMTSEREQRNPRVTHTTVRITIPEEKK